MDVQNSQESFVEMLNKIRGHILESLYTGSFKYDASKRTLNQHLDMARNLNDEVLRGRTLTTLAIIEAEHNNFIEAEGYFLQARDIFEAANDASRLGTTLTNLGELARTWGKVEEAARYFQETRKILTGEEHRAALVYSYNNEGLLWLNEGDIERAIPLLREALDLANRLAPMPTHVKQLLPETLDGLARAYLDLGDLEQSKRLAMDALERALELAQLKKMAMTYQTAARLAMQMDLPGEDMDAESLLAKCENNWRRFHSNVELGKFLVIKGDYRREQGDIEAARACYQEAVTCYENAALPAKVDEAVNRLNLL